MQTPRYRPDDAPEPKWWVNERGARTFRLSWVRLYAVMAFWEAIILGMLIGGSLLQSPGLLLAAFVCILVISFPLAAFFGTRVGREGLQGYTFWGTPSRIRWEDIDAARPSLCLGLPWLVVRSRVTRSAMWLPLFYADNRGFFKAISEFAPESCPLLEAPLPGIKRRA